MIKIDWRPTLLITALVIFWTVILETYFPNIPGWLDNLVCGGIGIITGFILPINKQSKTKKH